MSLSAFELQQAQWRDLVGGFILAFGDVEVVTLLLWKDHGKGTAPPFKKRVDRLLTVLKNIEPRNEELISCLEKAHKMADKRNIIAHNPVQAQVFEHGRTRELFAELAISSPAREDYIDDVALKELRAEAEAIASRLYAAICVTAKKNRTG